MLLSFALFSGICPPLLITHKPSSVAAADVSRRLATAFWCKSSSADTVFKRGSERIRTGSGDRREEKEPAKRQGKRRESLWGKKELREHRSRGESCPKYPPPHGSSRQLRPPTLRTVNTCEVNDLCLNRPCDPAADH